MKRTLLYILFSLIVSTLHAQSNQDIANVYIRRALETIEKSVNFDHARTLFEKAMKYTDTISDEKMAALGSSIYFEIHHKQPTIKEQLELLEKAKSYSTQYFKLTEERDTEEYLKNTDYYVSIQEKIEDLNLQLKIIEENRIKKEKEIRKIDSLKLIWQKKSSALSIKADTIYKFNKNKIALYKNNGFFGILDDLGEIIIDANEYEDAIAFDGYIILKNKAVEPTKLYCFNTNNKEGFRIPSVLKFNALSTHYGEVMLPRGNGRLVTYPNNSYQPFIYDLVVKKEVKIANLKEYLKELKKTDVIDKYNKEDEVKLGKEWYNFGGHLGGGIHPLYAVEEYKLVSFLCTIDGTVLKTDEGFEYIGSFYNNKFQVVNNGKISWINQNGTEVNAAKNEAGSYSGNSILNKLENGHYQIMRDGVIILGNETLEKLPVFLRNFSKKE